MSCLLGLTAEWVLRMVCVVLTWFAFGIAVDFIDCFVVVLIIYWLCVCWYFAVCACW